MNEAEVLRFFVRGGITPLSYPKRNYSAVRSGSAPLFPEADFVVRHYSLEGQWALA